MRNLALSAALALALASTGCMREDGPYHGPVPWDVKALHLSDYCHGANGTWYPPYEPAEWDADFEENGQYVKVVHIDFDLARGFILPCKDPDRRDATDLVIHYR